MIRVVIVGDKAHGIGVAGKGSPDGTHKEYKWSREVWEDIEVLAKAHGYPIEFTSYGDEEPGRIERVKAGNKICDKYKDYYPLFISLHNDASKADGTWGTARGISVWTTRGHDMADVFADIMLTNLHGMLTETKKRMYSPTKGAKDFESNFDVLAGSKTVKPKYNGILIECGFQDNKEDLALLKSPEFKKKVADAIMNGIEDINRYVVENNLK